MGLGVGLEMPRDFRVMLRVWRVGRGSAVGLGGEGFGVPETFLVELRVWRVVSEDMVK